MLTRAAAALARREWMAWTAVFVLVLMMQWPMLKGLWYQHMGEAPRSDIAWHTDFDTALAESARTGRPVLVDFAADWCPPCITMKHDVWPDAHVSAAVRDGYVPLLVDVDAHPQLAARYEVSGIPSVMVLDEHGRVLRTATFLGAGGMRQFLTHAE